MSRVERDLGRLVEWAAVNHYDTEHPHVHVVVRGVDRDGAQLFVEPAYIARGMRWSAQELATDWLGPRLESEIQQTYDREVAQERLTSLDRELARLAQGRRVDVASFDPRAAASPRSGGWTRAAGLSSRTRSSRRLASAMSPHIFETRTHTLLAVFHERCSSSSASSRILRSRSATNRSTSSRPVAALAIRTRDASAPGEERRCVRVRPSRVLARTARPPAVGDVDTHKDLSGQRPIGRTRAASSKHRVVRFTTRGAKAARSHLRYLGHLSSEAR
jgi:hypothetical protein